MSLFKGFQSRMLVKKGCLHKFNTRISENFLQVMQKYIYFYLIIHLIQFSLNIYRISVCYIS